MNESATSSGSGSTVAVRMGELAVCSGDGQLKTLLGSCIGLALYDVRNRVGGLAHIVLPDSRGQDAPVGKFVDTAIPELIGRIEQVGGNRQKLQAKFAGGANMLCTSSTTTIGDQNLAAINRELASRSIPIVATHCGGIQGRRMIFRPATGVVIIEVVGSETIEI